MTAKTSAEMREALRLVMAGATGRQAAKQAGVREESLYRRAEYKAFRASQKVNFAGKAQNCEKGGGD